MMKIELPCPNCVRMQLEADGSLPTPLSVRDSFIPDKATMDSEYEEVLNFLNESARVSPILILGSQAILDKETKRTC